MNILLEIIFAALASLISSRCFYPHMLRIAKKNGMLDYPSARKTQSEPVPVGGGIVVFFGLIVGVYTFLAIHGQAQVFVTPKITPVLLGAAIILYIGVLDDIYGISPVFRIAIETIVLLGLIFSSGTCIDSFHGVFGINEISWWIAVPLTVFAGVGIINAYNMVDGVNGLSSGLCIISSIFYGIIAYKRVDTLNAVLAFCYAASLLPFFLHNVFGKKSKMFIGDAGTMTMGFIVSWLVMKVLSKDNLTTIFLNANGAKSVGLIAMVIAVSSVPVADTLRVMFSRMLRHESPFQPDRTHLHHAFLDAGVSHSVTTLVEIVLNALIVFFWYLSYKCGASVNMQLLIVVVASMILVWGVYFYLHCNTKRNKDFFVSRNARLTHFGHTKWWLAIQSYLDKFCD